MLYTLYGDIEAIDFWEKSKKKREWLKILDVFYAYHGNCALVVEISN